MMGKKDSNIAILALILFVIADVSFFSPFVSGEEGAAGIKKTATGGVKAGAKKAKKTKGKKLPDDKGALDVAELELFLG
jgi:hypothetical protein